MIHLFMGVCGSGKSTVGAKFAEALQLPFADADAYHPPENIAKMSKRIPLTDEDRLPWLKSLHEWMQKRVVDGQSAVLASSALKESYRQLLSDGLPVRWYLLHGDKQILQQRMGDRTDHFMPATLLDSQWEILEIPDYAVLLDIRKSPEELVSELLAMHQKQDH